MDHLLTKRFTQCLENDIDQESCKSSAFKEQAFDTGPAYTIFFLSTFFANVIILNMGIALIGDTYAYFMEHREQFERSFKIHAVIHWSPFVRSSSSKDERGFFLYHIRVIDGIMAPDDVSFWSGSVNEITKITE